MSDDDKTKEDQRGAWERFMDKMTPNFSIGGILQALFFAIILYVAAHSETVQRFIGGFLNEKDATGKEIPNSGYDKVHGWISGADSTLGGSLPDFVLDKVDVTDVLQNPDPENTKVKAFIDKLPPSLQDIAKDKTKLSALTNVIFSANNVNGKMSAKQLKDAVTNEKTLLALVTQQPALAKEIIGALKKGAVSTDDSKSKEMMKQMMASVKTIVDGPQLATLFDKAHREQTIALLVELDSSVSPADLNAFLEQFPPETEAGLNALRKRIVPTLTKLAAGTASTETSSSTQNDASKNNDNTASTENTAAKGNTQNTTAGDQNKQETTSSATTMAKEEIPGYASLAEGMLLVKLEGKDSLKSAVKTLRKELGDETFLTLLNAMQPDNQRLPHTEKYDAELKKSKTPDAVLRMLSLNNLETVTKFLNTQGMDLNLLTDKPLTPKEQKQIEELKALDPNKTSANKTSTNSTPASPEYVNAIKKMAATGQDPETLTTFFKKGEAPEKYLESLMGAGFESYATKGKGVKTTYTSEERARVEKELTPIVTVIKKEITDPAMRAILTEHNLLDIMVFGKDLRSQTPPIGIKNAATVTNALMDYLNNKPTSMAKNAKLVAGHFAANRFAGPFKKMLGSLQIGKNTLIDAIEEQWGDGNDGKGLRAILSNENAVRHLAEAMEAKSAAAKEKIITSDEILDKNVNMWKTGPLQIISAAAGNKITAVMDVGNGTDVSPLSYTSEPNAKDRIRIS